MKYDYMNDMQKAAIEYIDGPLLIIAGAGSGKTGVLTHRIAHMIDDLGINPFNILAITFTNKAAGEMRERVDKLAGMGAEAAWIMTFHAACVRILRRHIDKLGYTSNFTIYDTDDQKSIIKEVCKRLNIDSKKEREILSRISSAKDELVTPDELYMVAGNNYQERMVAEAYRVYQEQLKSNNAVDFDDIICLTIRLFKKCPDVLSMYQNRFRYIMVDEYQDTNTAQFEFIRLLSGQHQNLCVVGDDDQSIYKFRGANIRNILNFEEYYPGAKVIKLEQNYRSTSNILQVANHVIKNNFERKDKTLWTDAKEGDIVSFVTYERDIDEAEDVVAEIDRLTQNGFTCSDVAILYRTNNQSRIFEEKLINRSIPYRIYGAINFYGRKEIKDILAYLKTVNNGEDDLSVKRILNIPKRGIGDTSASYADEYAYENGINFYEALERASQIDKLKRASTKISSFIKDISTLRRMSGEFSISEFIKQLVEYIKYDEYIDANDDPIVAGERKENINELISKAAIYEEEEPEPTLSGFLENVALVSDIDNLSESNEQVSLMTIHSAKGLEFPVVFLVGMEDGLFPSYMSLDEESGIEEERRLCYVGITRAKEKLYLSAAKTRMFRGELQNSKVSRFIREIPPMLLNKTAKGYSPFSRETRENVNAYFNKPARVSMPRSEMHSFEAPKPLTFTELPYGVGDTVFHVKFGTGKVLEIKSGGKDFEVTVDFGTSGIKKMFAGFAKLTKV